MEGKKGSGDGWRRKGKKRETKGEMAKGGDMEFVYTASPFYKVLALIPFHTYAIQDAVLCGCRRRFSAVLQPDRTAEKPY